MAKRTPGDEPRRVVVAGTSFGRVYLDALRRRPDRWRLVGVLARGSRAARAVADEHGVPLATRVADLPRADVACVVVGSGLLGGAGTEIAADLLRRGVHVLQEHPLHPDDLRTVLAAAREGEAVHHVHTLHPGLAPVREFLAAAQALRARRTVRFVEVAVSSQVLYPLLDVLGRALGGLRPWSFTPVGAAEGPHPFRTLEATVGGVPVGLRVQNQVHPGDPDNHAHLLHRITLGTDAGLLTLLDPHGPAVWSARLHAARDGDGRLVMDGPADPSRDLPRSATVAPAAGTWRDVYASLWPDAVDHALERLCAEIALPPARRTAAGHAAAVARCWADATAALGPPQLVHPADPVPLDPADLSADLLSEEP